MVKNKLEKKFSASLKADPDLWGMKLHNNPLAHQNTPADYIVEYEGQIRGWFHALHVLSTGIFGKEAFKNVHVHGTLVALLVA